MAIGPRVTCRDTMAFPAPVQVENLPSSNVSWVMEAAWVGFTAREKPVETIRLVVPDYQNLGRAGSSLAGFNSDQLLRIPVQFETQPIHLCSVQALVIGNRLVD